MAVILCHILITMCHFKYATLNHFLITHVQLSGFIYLFMYLFSFVCLQASTLSSEVSLLVMSMDTPASLGDQRKQKRLKLAINSEYMVLGQGSPSSHL